MAKILIVEDDAETRRTLENWFSFEHYQVESVADGREAIDRLTVSDYDLILLDWDIPHVSGLEVCRYARSKRNSVPILFLTGNTDANAVELGLDSGADDFVSKPFSLKQVSARVRALLRRPRKVVSTAIQVRDVKLDTASRTVYLGGKKLELAPKEYEVLELFMRHPNHLFSADAIIQRVWKSTDEVNDVSVRNCIRALRKELGTDLIENRYGQGYRLVVAESQEMPE